VNLKRLCLGLGVASLVSVYGIACGPNSKQGTQAGTTEGDDSGNLKGPEVASFEVIQQYSTSKGTIFKKIKHPTFGEAWVEPSGLLWSSLQQTSASGADDHLVSFESAQGICKQLGGRIPTDEEFDLLVDQTEFQNGRFTEQGKKDYDTILPDGFNRYTWMSNHRARLVESSPRPRNDAITVRYADHAVVRCVADLLPPPDYSKNDLEVNAKCVKQYSPSMPRVQSSNHDVNQCLDLQGVYRVKDRYNIDGRFTLEGHESYTFQTTTHQNRKEYSIDHYVSSSSGRASSFKLVADGIAHFQSYDEYSKNERATRMILCDKTGLHFLRIFQEKDQRPVISEHLLIKLGDQPNELKFWECRGDQWGAIGVMRKS
jgi:hypothetical protein